MSNDDSSHHDRSPQHHHPYPSYPSSHPLSFLTPQNLRIPPPITTNSIKNFNPHTIASDALSTRVIIHPRFPRLAQAFLQHKRTHGSHAEKTLYCHADFTWETLISRLINARPYAFLTSADTTLLRNGKFLPHAREQWDRVGTDLEDLNEDLKLQDYLSYDEILLSSFIGVSGESHFINDGSRHNCGRPGKPGTFEPRGVIVGLVGARFERRGRMDSILCLPGCEGEQILQDQRVTEMVLKFLGARRRRSEPDVAFDRTVYRARMRITAEMLLLEANGRAREDERGRTAYVYVVGLGLGVWEIDKCQTVEYVAAFANAIEDCEIPRVSTVEFAWMSIPRGSREVVVKAAAKKGIRVLFSRRNPAAKLGGEEELLVLSYAWDGNAFPGNEYWTCSLDASGDPAAACMSTIGELHNPLVNPYTKRIVVAGS